MRFSQSFLFLSSMFSPKKTVSDYLAGAGLQKSLGKTSKLHKKLVQSDLLLNIWD